MKSLARMLSVALALILIPAITAVPACAQTVTSEAYFTISPESRDYKVGDTVQATLYLTNIPTSVSVQSVGIRLDFSNNYLQYTGYHVPTSSLYDEADWVDQNTSSGGNASPNVSGYISFTASTTETVPLTAQTPLLVVTFKAKKAGTATLKYQFDTTDSYTIVITSTPDVDVTDRDQTTDAQYTIMGSALPTTGIFDNTVGLFGVGAGCVLAGVVFRFSKGSFEKKNFASAVFE